MVTYVRMDVLTLPAAMERVASVDMSATMQQHTKPLDISTVLQVAETLESTLCRSFGPEGSQVLFFKSTGELIITKDGRRILEYLLLDHPVARIIVNAASKHYSVTGDGVKSFVLLLCAFLREIQRMIDKKEDLILSGNSALKLKSKNKCHVLRRISDILMTFQSRVLEPIIQKFLRPHFLSVYTNMNGKVTLCRETLQQTLDTYFCGRNSCNNQQFISRMACDYLYKCLCCADGILEVVGFVDSCFSELHTQVPGFPVGNSRILPGLVIHRDFSVYCPAEGDLQALLITDQIHHSLSASDVGFVVSSNTQLRVSQEHLEQRTEDIMKQLQNNQIKLILSGVKQHEIVTFYAKQNNISIVECIPSEEMDLLCRATGVTPVSIPLASPLQDNSFLVNSCQRILLGDKKYIQLVFNGSLTFRPHSVVLYGPVRGLTEQIASSFHGAFKMLKHFFQTIDASWEHPLNNPDVCLPNRRASVEEQRVICSICQNDSDHCNCHLQRMHRYTPMNCKHNVAGVEWTLGEPTGRLNACSQTGSGTHNMQIHQLDQTLQHAAEAGRSKYFIHPNSRVKVIEDVPLHNWDTLSVNTGLLLPSGGVFEMLLHYHLHNVSKSCQEEELATVCSIFGEALLCIPKRIYQAKHGRASFPSVYKQCTESSREPKYITQRGLESVSCKYQLMVSVLQCISTLLKIDFIIGVKKGPQTAKCDEID